MTPQRHELVLEATADGVSWRELECRYKVGDVTRLKLVPPLHMPRLDWRLWLLAQGRPVSSWYDALLGTPTGRLEPRREQTRAAHLATAAMLHLVPPPRGAERLVEGSPDVLALLEPPPPGQVHGPWLEARGRAYAYRMGRGSGEARWVRWPRGEKDPTPDPHRAMASTESQKSN